MGSRVGAGWEQEWEQKPTSKINPMAKKGRVGGRLGAGVGEGARVGEGAGVGDGARVGEGAKAEAR